MVITLKEFKAMRKKLGISNSSKEILSGFQEIYKFNITDDLTKRASNLISNIRKDKKSVPKTQPYKEDHIGFAPKPTTKHQYLIKPGQVALLRRVAK